MAKQQTHHLTRKLVWSAEKPSQAGWFWHRGTYRDPAPIIVEVDEAGYFKWPDGSFDDVNVIGGRMGWSTRTTGQPERLTERLRRSIAKRGLS